MEEGNASHRAQGVDVWSLQSYGDAVEEDKDQHHVVKHFVGNDLLACHSEPGERWEEQILWKFGSGKETLLLMCHQHQPRWGGSISTGFSREYD